MRIGFLTEKLRKEACVKGFCVLLAWGVAACAAAAPPEGQFIFPLQGKHVHSSTITPLPDGRMAAAWFHGSGERSANDVVVQGAIYDPDAASWGPVSVFADTPNLPDCNPVLFTDPDGRLWLIWCVVQANRWEQCILKWRRASTIGADGVPVWDWQDIILLQPGEDFPEQLRAGFNAIGYDQPMWAEYARAYDDLLVKAAEDPVKRNIGWMTRTNVTVLSSGRWVLPLYSDGYNVSLVALSDDEGATWRASAPIVGLGNIQPAVVERADGGLVAYMRDNGDVPKRIMTSTSADGGETWTPATDMDLPNPGASVAARALSNGRWVLAYNDLEDGRHRLAIATSDNEGASWKFRTYLDTTDEGTGGFGYPTIAEDSEGRAHVTYSYSLRDQGATIKHVILPPSITH